MPVRARPQAVTLVDWSNPFSRYLQRLVIDNSGAVDRARDELPTRDGGCTYSNAIDGRVLTFDGTLDGLSFAEPVWGIISDPQLYTIWARVYSTASGTVDRNICSLGDTGGGTGAYSVQLRRETASKVSAYHFAAGADQSAVDNTFVDSAWIDYCLTWDGLNIQLYNNGALVGQTVSGTVTTLRTTNTLNVGENNFNDGKKGWLGNISLFAYWRGRCFTAAEVFAFNNDRWQLTLGADVEEWFEYATAGAVVGPSTELLGQACL